MTQPAVLRVLNGRLAGAEKVLAPGERLSVGHQFWQDITLREPGVRGIAAEIALGDDGQAQFTVLSGEVSLLGSRLGAGESAILPAYVPVSLGGTAIAWGDPASARWSDAGALAVAVPSPPPPPLTPQDRAIAAADRIGAEAKRLFTGWRLAAVAGLGLLLVGASSALPAIDALGLRPNEAERVSRALGSAGLPGLQTIEDSASGGVIVTGIVADEAARARAEEALRNAHVAGTIDVRTSSQLALAAADVARLRGLEANARPLSRTGVELHTTPLQPQDRAQLVQAVRSDVGGIGRLAIVDDLLPADEAPVRTIADATKRVSTVVAGDPAYVRTADGSLYFAGAMMPSGHRLVAIKDRTVVLEKNGRTTEITF